MDSDEIRALYREVFFKTLTKLLAGNNQTDVDSGVTLSHADSVEFAVKRKLLAVALRFLNLEIGRRGEWPSSDKQLCRD